MSSEGVYQLPEPSPHCGASKHPRIPVPLPNQTGKLDGSIDQVGSFYVCVCMCVCVCAHVCFDEQ